jgi:hypothetical protein
VRSAECLRGVRQDAEDPRLERRAPFEAVEAAEDADPGLLDDFFRHLAGRYEDLRDANHRAVVALDELPERALVSFAQRFERLALRLGRGRLDLGHPVTVTNAAPARLGARAARGGET